MILSIFEVTYHENFLAMREQFTEFIREVAKVSVVMSYFMNPIHFFLLVEEGILKMHAQ